MAKLRAKAPSDSVKKGMGKQTKRFIDQKDSALQLASAIVDVQENKAREKAEKNHAHAQPAARNESRSRPSSKDKLKQAKAAVKAQNLRAKKDKLKARKAARKPLAAGPTAPAQHSTQQKLPASAPAKRKRVAFA